MILEMSHKIKEMFDVKVIIARFKFFRSWHFHFVVNIVLHIPLGPLFFNGPSADECCVIESCVRRRRQEIDHPKVLVLKNLIRTYNMVSEGIG